MRCAFFLLFLALGCGISVSPSEPGDGGRPSDALDARVDPPRFPDADLADADPPDANPPDADPPDADPPDADGGLPESCWSGTAVACDCPGGRAGFLYCVDARWADCECPPDVAPPPPDAGPGDGGIGDSGPGGPCTGDPEWCDGRDNDCDGIIDEGEPCPDPTVRNTLPFSGTVYLELVFLDGTFALEPISPAGGPRITGVPGGVRFRRSDGAMVFSDWRAGIFEHVPGGAPRELSTPPCFDGVRFNGWGFDGAGRLHYVCDESLRRGAGVGEVLGSMPRWRGIQDVFAGGRMLTAWTATDSGFQHELVDVDGSILSWAPTDTLVGELTGLTGSSTIVGDVGFVAFNRVYRGRTRREVVIFRVDADSTRWSLVRRIPVPGAVRHGVALPDGRFFWLTRACCAGGLSVQGVFEAPLEGPVRVVWSDADAPSAVGRRLVIR